MGNGAVGLVGHSQIEELRHLQQNRLLRHGKIPMRKCILGVAADIRDAIGPQPLRRVVFRVEADAKKVSFGIKGRVGRQQLIDRRKVTRYAGTELGRGAARVDEGDQQRLAPELAQMDGVPVLIAQLEIRHIVPRRGHVIGDRGPVIGPGLRHHHDVIQQIVGVGVRRDK